MSYPSNRPRNFRLHQLYVLTAVDPATNAEGIIHVAGPAGEIHMMIDSDESLVRRVFTDPIYGPLRTAYPDLRVLCFTKMEDVTARFKK